MAHIHMNHFAESFFEKAFVQWTWLSGTYGGFNDHGLVQIYGENLFTFSRVVEQRGTSLFIVFFKSLLF